MKKILIIAPHSDDELLGCGGYILSQIKQGAQVHVVFGTVGGCDIRQPIERRLQEVDLVAREAGYSYDILYHNKDAEMDTIPAREITTAIDKILSSFKPDEVFVNYPSHHQDHVVIYQCTRAAMRLKEDSMPSLFALYEYPFVNSGDKIPGGLFYYDINEFIDEKVRLFYHYKTQIKTLPSPLNEDGIKALARMRGLECGRTYAEMFYIQKMVK